MPRKKKMPLTNVPQEPPVRITHEQDSQANYFLMGSIFLKSTILALIIVFISLFATFSVFSYKYLHTLSTHAGLSVGQLISVARSGWTTSVVESEGRKNILVLGVDSLSTRNNETINTDTMMVASVNLSNGGITTFSIPRDLFLRVRGTKINGIYGSEIKKGSANPENEVKNAVENLTGIPIHNVLLLEIEKVGQVIDAIGGLDIEVERRFTDERYPNENLESTVLIPDLQYRTVSFEAGTEHMNGARALEYIRSRHSKDPIEGSDDARARRQQKVIEALIAKFSDKGLLKQPAYLGDLIRIYRENFEASLSLQELIALGRVYLTIGKFPMIESQHFGIQGVDSEAQLYHPNRFYTGQWVYLPIDPAGEQIKSVVKKWLE